MRIGAYYYPEQWPENQWVRDLKRMAELGFEFTHFAEFAWSRLEPEDNRFEFEWLDRAVGIAAANGLKVIMCTQSCTPPAWLVEKHPEILLEDEMYHRREHGTRANMSFASDTFIYYVERITREIAKRYGNNPNVIGWQLHNEPFGHKDYSSASQKKFRFWLKNKYQTIERLNHDWDNAFWSQEYNHFGQIRIPTEHFTGWGINPSHMLDFNMYNADVVANFLDFSARILKDHISENQWITTNYISHIENADARRTCELDFSSFTCYLVYGEPGIGELGFRLGWPQGVDFGTAFYKPIGGRTGIMELQPGQVNWSKVNPQVQPGAIRMWLWNAWSAGNNFVCTYRFRQPVFGFEQFHHGIMNPDGITLSQGGREYAQFIQEFNQLIKSKPGIEEECAPSKIAILWTHENRWDIENHKQTNKWNTMGHMFKYFDIARTTGLPIEFVDEHSDLSKFQFLIVPSLQMLDSSLVQKWSDFASCGGHVIISCRTGIKNKKGHLWEADWAAPINGLIGSKILFYDVLPDGISGDVTMKGKNHKWESWADILEPHPGTRVLATYSDHYYAGKAAATQRTVGKGSVTYIGVDTQSGELEKMLSRELFTKYNPAVLNHPEGVYHHVRDGYHVFVNYSSGTHQLNIPSKAKIVLGKPAIAPAGVTIYTF